MPPKGKPDTAGYQRFKKELAAGTPGKLKVLHGEETYLRDHYLGKLRSLLLTGGMGTFNLHEVPARELSPRRLEEALDCLPMMAERTLVLVTDFDLFKAGEKDREEFIKLLGDLPDYVCLVFLYDLIPYKGAARTKLAGAITQNGVVVNFARQDRLVSPGCLPLSAGPCTLCARCTCPDKPCRRPKQRLSSMDAYGLCVSDVCVLSGLAYNYGPNSLTYTYCVFYDSEE